MRRGRAILVDKHDVKVTDTEVLERVRALVLPPAWTDVWICGNSRGHLQATGRDARGRKQYRYHAEWREVRDATKYHRMLSFAAALPSIRARVNADLNAHGLPRAKVLATVVRLLEVTLIRVGNEEYARDNGSYGLTTMRDDHLTVSGTTASFHFRGKSGKMHAISVREPRLARIVRKCQELPGHELFQYVDADGTTHAIDSSDVNDYLHDCAGAEFSAKDFRTWSGTVLAALTLVSMPKAESETARKRSIVTAIKQVSEKLGNTPSVCRKCYVHPHVLDSYQRGVLKLRLPAALAADPHALTPQERAVAAMLARSERQSSRSPSTRKRAMLSAC